ncbi:MAG: CheB methylesterase domain-containing protein, partial [Vicinamibacterales bacterium]|nr:CheB methylesterase domain-containing protein [Vicinamibacterales bacterium]
PPVAAPAPAPAPARPPGVGSTVGIVAIGVSTGGPNALAAVMPALPAALPVPIVIVQHMPPMFTKMLADRLDAQSAVAVVEAAEGMTLQPGTAYLAPGDFHMRLVQRGTGVVIALDQGPPENSCRPAVDVLFRSVAGLYGAQALAVVLTGMGQDGLLGAERLREAHGQVIVQDEATSVVWGMPGAVARAGLADRVLPLELIAQDVARRVAQGRPAPGWQQAARAAEVGTGHGRH